MSADSACFRVDPDWDLRIIRATLSGEWSRDLDDRFIAAILAGHRESGFGRVLIDHRDLTHTATWSEIFFRAEDLSDEAIRFTKIAFLYSDPSPDLPDRYAFLVTAFHNRGVNLAAFDDDEAAALRWLFD